MLTHLPLQNIPQQSATEQAHQNDIKGNCKSQESNFALIQDKENSQVKPLGTEKVKYIYIYHLPFLACSPKTGCCLYQSKSKVIQITIFYFLLTGSTKFCNLFKSICNAHISCTYHYCGSTDNFLIGPEKNTSNSSKTKRKVSKAYEKLKRKLLKLCSFFSVYQA